MKIFTLWPGDAAGPGGTVSQEAYERECPSGSSATLKALRTVDAVYLDLHGAMVTTHLMDGEGELLRRVREVVGLPMPLWPAWICTPMSPKQCWRERTCWSPIVPTRMSIWPKRAHGSSRCCATGAGGAGVGRGRGGGFPSSSPCAGKGVRGPAKAIYGALRATRPATVASLSLAMGFPAADTPFAARPYGRMRIASRRHRIWQAACRKRSRRRVAVRRADPDAARRRRGGLESRSVHRGPVVIRTLRTTPARGEAATPWA
ncbi:hypothetical protein CDEF62S_00479 [Castellaniella defragrans]